MRHCEFAILRAFNFAIAEQLSKAAQPVLSRRVFCFRFAERRHELLA